MDVPSRNVLITGGTGFIGRSLLEFLPRQGYAVHVVSRNPAGKKRVLQSAAGLHSWRDIQQASWWDSTGPFHSVIHLAGAGIASRPWTRRRRRILWNSRVESTRNLAAAILTHASSAPAMFFQGSAIGYYGSYVRPSECRRLDQQQTCEAVLPNGPGYLASLCNAWECASKPIRDAGIRRIVLRTGVVLGPDGGFFRIARRLLSVYCGVFAGKPTAWLSWIHIDDLCRSIDFLMKHPESQGVYNLTAPYPIQQIRMYRNLAYKMRRPLWSHIPPEWLEFLPGSMGREMVGANQYILPHRLLDSGFQFQYPDMNSALDRLLTAR